MRLFVYTGVTALSMLGCGDDGTATPAAIIDSPHANNVCGVVWDVQWRLGERVRGATPDALDLSRYPLSAEGIFLSPAGTGCTDAIAARLTAMCAPCDASPGDCEPLVRALFREVPEACSRCGDAVCYRGESEASCAPDCGTSCGDGQCSALESPLTCPNDCAQPCGDGFCGGGETPESCPPDCRYSVGDGLCEQGESPENSPQDCGFATCGDEFCQTYETPLRCPEDCCWPAVCDTGYAPRCRGADTVEICEPSGLSQCPEVIASELCRLGCTEDAAVGARCRTCAELVQATFAGARSPCVVGEAPLCEGLGRWTCLPMPAGEECGFRTYETCPEGCVNGACTLDCAARIAALERPELGTGCALTMPDTCATSERIRCQPIDGVADCGQLVHETCAEGSACLLDACAPCTPDACAPGSRRCAPNGAATVELCVGTSYCPGWGVLEPCIGAASQCMTEGPSMAFCTTPP